METGNYDLIINLLFHKDIKKVKRINLYLCGVTNTSTNSSDVSFSFATYKMKLYYIDQCIVIGKWYENMKQAQYSKNILR